MFKYFKIIILIVLLVLFIIPQTVSAFSLVPCGRSEDDPDTPDINETERCTLCHIFIMLQIIINGISIAILAWAVIYITIGGITIMVAGGSPDKASQGKRMITYAIVGIIIAFGAWFIINVIMNALVDRDKLPLPWNQIKCTPTTPDTHKECVDSACKDIEGEGEDQCITDVECAAAPKETNICRCEWGAEWEAEKHVNANTFSTPEECKNNCLSYCQKNFNYLNNYCCVENENQKCEGDPLGVDEKKWCVCETPVYTVDPKQYPGLTTILGADIKGTDLETKESCATGCVSLNANQYCYQRNLTDLNNANLYCASENELENKKASCVIIEDISYNDQITCFPSVKDCYDTITEGALGADKDCMANCWIDGNRYCYCTEGMATSCNSSNPHALVVDSKEKTTGTFLSAFSCIKNCGYSQGRCRLGGLSDLPKCIPGEPEEEDQWCKRTAPAGSENWVLNPPPGGAMDEQKGDASPQLTNFLNCMYGKIPELKINSISSNILCDNPECDISESGCGHAANSCHYGGTNCTGESYAVDFHTNISCLDIKKAAKECDSTAWVNWEYNHTHISVNNRNCGCNESAEGNPCP